MLISLEASADTIQYSRDAIHNLRQSTKGFNGFLHLADRILKTFNGLGRGLDKLINRQGRRSKGQPIDKVQKPKRPPGKWILVEFRKSVSQFILHLFQEIKKSGQSILNLFEKSVEPFKTRKFKILTNGLDKRVGSVCRISDSRKELADDSRNSEDTIAKPQQSTKQFPRYTRQREDNIDTYFDNGKQTFERALQILGLGITQFKMFCQIFKTFAESGQLLRCYRREYLPKSFRNRLDDTQDPFKRISKGVDDVSPSSKFLPITEHLVPGIRRSTDHSTKDIVNICIKLFSFLKIPNDDPPGGTPSGSKSLSQSAHQLRKGFDLRCGICHGLIVGKPLHRLNENIRRQPILLQ